MAYANNIYTDGDLFVPRLTSLGVGDTSGVEAAKGEKKGGWAISNKSGTLDAFRKPISGYKCTRTAVQETSKTLNSRRALKRAPLKSIQEPLPLKPHPGNPKAPFSYRIIPCTPGTKLSTQSPLHTEETPAPTIAPDNAPSGPKYVYIHSTYHKGTVSWGITSEFICCKKPSGFKKNVHWATADFVALAEGIRQVNSSLEGKKGGCEYTLVFKNIRVPIIASRIRRLVLDKGRTPTVGESSEMRIPSRLVESLASLILNSNNQGLRLRFCCSKRKRTISTRAEQMAIRQMNNSESYIGLHY